VGSISWTLAGHIPASVFAVGGGALGLFASGEDKASGALAVWRSTDGVHWKKAVVEGNGRIFDFAVDRAPGVAVGCTRCTSDGDPIKAAVWTSSDGTSWRLVPLHEQPAEVVGVIEWRGGFVAVGVSHVDLSGGNDCTIGAWRSGDGAIWGRATPVATDACGVDLSATPDTLAMVTKSIWTSADGRSWSRRDSEPHADGEPVRFWQLAEPGPELIAYGQQCRYDPGLGTDACRAAFSISADGSSWTDAPAQLALTEWVASHVVVFADRVVALGRAIDGPTVVAESRDGLTWERGGLGSYADIMGLVVIGDTIYAVTESGDVWAGTRD
jgi:hypothetical protein